MFYIQNIKPSNAVFLRYRKNKYIITDCFELFDVSTGKIFGKLGNFYEQIEKVLDNKGQLLAIRREDKLFKYNPLRHDTELNYIRHVNGLLTYDELKKALEAQNVHYGLLHVTYKKTMNKFEQTLKIYGGTKKFNTDFGSYHGLFLEKKKTKYGQEYATGAKQNVQINIYRFLIEKKRNIYLYKYTMTPSIL